MGGARLGTVKGTNSIGLALTGTCGTWGCCSVLLFRSRQEQDPTSTCGMCTPATAVVSVTGGRCWQEHCCRTTGCWQEHCWRTCWWQEHWCPHWPWVWWDELAYGSVREAWTTRGRRGPTAVCWVLLLLEPRGFQTAQGYTPTRLYPTNTGVGAKAATCLFLDDSELVVEGGQRFATTDLLHDHRRIWRFGLAQARLGKVR